MTVVSISETYDLKTTKGKIGVIGIHTPSGDYIDRLWDGLRKNHRFIKVRSCDIVLSCASVLPADPLQIGEDANKIAPQDMFNPILYKAVTNESFETVINRMYTFSDINSGDSLAVGNDLFSGSSADQADIYYSMLASEGFRKAMVQQGLTMRGLRPLVHPVLTSFGNQYMSPDMAGLTKSNLVRTDGDAMTTAVSVNYSAFRGRPIPMPRIPTSSSISKQDGFTSDNQEVTRLGALVIPKTYVACILIPPAFLNVTYFRMRVRWTFEFQEIMPNTERMTATGMASVGAALHYQNYTITPDPTSKEIEGRMDTVESVADFGNVDAQSIMVN